MRGLERESKSLLLSIPVSQAPGRAREPLTASPQSSFKEQKPERPGKIACPWAGGLFMSVSGPQSFKEQKPQGRVPTREERPGRPYVHPGSRGPLSARGSFPSLCRLHYLKSLHCVVLLQDFRPESFFFLRSNTEPARSALPGSLSTCLRRDRNPNGMNSPHLRNVLCKA